MRKKLKSDDSVNDSVNDSVDDSEDDFEDDEEMMEDNLLSNAQEEKDGHKAMAKWFISAGVNPNTIKTASFAKFMRLLNPNFPLSVPLVKKEVLGLH